MAPWPAFFTESKMHVIKASMVKKKRKKKPFSAVIGLQTV